jgi:hypothetical protein
MKATPQAIEELHPFSFKNIASSRLCAFALNLTGPILSIAEVSRIEVASP